MYGLNVKFETALIIFFSLTFFCCFGLSQFLGPIVFYCWSSGLGLRTQLKNILNEIKLNETIGSVF